MPGSQAIDGCLAFFFITVILLLCLRSALVFISLCGKMVFLYFEDGASVGHGDDAPGDRGSHAWVGLNNNA